MKILILNPNTSEPFTSSIQAAANKLKRSDTEVLAVNPASGPNTIDGKYDLILCLQSSMEMVIRYSDQYDGIIVACFSDHPVIHGAREAISKPVIGIMEAALYMACLIGKTFSVVTPPDRAKGQLWEEIRGFGLENRCASVRTAGIAVSDLESPSDENVRDRILDRSRKAIVEDGAEVIVLGCGGMAGLDKDLQKILGVPVIDGVSAALKIMEAMIEYGVTTSKSGTYAYPDPKPIVGLPSILSVPYGHQH